MSIHAGRTKPGALLPGICSAAHGTLLLREHTDRMPAMLIYLGQHVAVSERAPKATAGRGTIMQQQ